MRVIRSDDKIPIQNWNVTQKPVPYRCQDFNFYPLKDVIQKQDECVFRVASQTELQPVELIDRSENFYSDTGNATNTLKFLINNWTRTVYS